MDENKEGYYSLIDVIITLKSFISYLKKRWYLLFLVACIGGLLGGIYYYLQKPHFEAEATFILEEKSSSGGLSTLASQFGVSLGSLSGNGNIFAGDNILDILKSKTVVQQVLLSRIEQGDPNSQTLADLYLEFTGKKKKWTEDTRFSNFRFEPLIDSLSPIQDSVLNDIYSQIIKKDLVTERLAKQGTIIRVKVKSINPFFARLMTERLISAASDLYLNLKVGTAKVNIMELQRRSDSLLYLLNRKSYSSAASMPLDINPGIKTAAVPVEIANRDKTVLATLYAEVTKNLEASKVLLSQQTPVIQILDRPSALLDDKNKGILFLGILFSSVFVLVYILTAFIAFFIAKQSY